MNRKRVKRVDYKRREKKIRGMGDRVEREEETKGKKKRKGKKGA